MAMDINCKNEDEYLGKNGRCCQRCPAGSYMQAECDRTTATKCGECGREEYTATKNHLNKCHVCKDCSSNNNQKKIKDCTAQEDTVCECVTGFYCNNDHCDHCQTVKYCMLGEGVIAQATRTNDTICAPCEGGTYSNVTDFHSPCQKHTRCEVFGRVLKTPGTPTTDAICGDFKSHCSWMLPAALWSGLVLTALVLFGLHCWRKKRKSYKPAISTVPVALTEMVPPTPVSELELPLPSKEMNGHHQESCMDVCNFKLFPPDDSAVNCSSEDNVDSSNLPITPLKASVSFAESNHISGSAGYCTGNFHRTYSEPQEDEWCGT